MLNNIMDVTDPTSKIKEGNCLANVHCQMAMMPKICVLKDCTNRASTIKQSAKNRVVAVMLNSCDNPK